jgi:hypothetical protein
MRKCILDAIADSVNTSWMNAPVCKANLNELLGTHRTVSRRMEETGGRESFTGKLRVGDLASEGE